MAWLVSSPIVSTIRQYLYDFVGLLYPRVCHACGQGLTQQEDTLCIHCEFELPQTGFHLLADNPVVQRFWGRVPVQQGTALYVFEKGGKVQHLIHQMKFKGKKDIGLFLGRKMGRLLAESPLYRDIDLVVPIPLHKKRLRERGYNQCDLFAQGIAEAMNIAWQPNALVRNHYSASQTKKGRQARWENVQALFGINPKVDLTGKTILLVDDVITTGATMDACCTALLQAQDVKVNVASIAVVL